MTLHCGPDPRDQRRRSQVRDAEGQQLRRPVDPLHLEANQHPHHLQQRVSGGLVLVVPGHVAEQHSAGLGTQHRWHDGRVQQRQHDALVGEERRHHLEPHGPDAGRQPPDARQVPRSNLLWRGDDRDALPVQHAPRPGQVRPMAARPGVRQAERLVGQWVLARPGSQRDVGSDVDLRQVAHRSAARVLPCLTAQQTQNPDVDAVHRAGPGHDVVDLPPPLRRHVEGRQGAEQLAVGSAEHQRDLTIGHDGRLGVLHAADQRFSTRRDPLCGATRLPARRGFAGGSAS